MRTIMPTGIKVLQMKIPEKTELLIMIQIGSE